MRRAERDVDMEHPRFNPATVARFAALLLAVAAFAVTGCNSTRPPTTGATALPTTSPAEQSELAEAKDLFYRSVAGDRAVLPRAQQILHDLGGGQARDPKIVAYAGAAELLQASRSQNFFEKAHLGQEGIALEDRALAAAPGDLEVRFLRGVTFYQLPPFLGRKEAGINDLTYVAQVAEAAARDGRLDPRAASADLVYYGKTREESYDEAGALAAWRAALRIDPNSQAGRDAIKHLAEHHATGASESAGADARK